jgi:hypothetical protein
MQDGDTTTDNIQHTNTVHFEEGSGIDVNITDSTGPIYQITFKQNIATMTALTSGLLGTDELAVSDGGTMKKMDVSVMNAYFNANLAFNNYSHPNHSGHVSSSGDAGTTLLVAAITGQTALTSGLLATDELVLSDGGVIKRMDVSVLNEIVNTVDGARVYVQSGTPGSPATGDLWIDTS